MTTGKRQVIVRISIPPTATIRSAMETITRAPRRGFAAPAGLALITNPAGRLLGIATDGDIRRAIEGGATLEDPISRAMNRTPFLITGEKPNADILAEVLAEIKAKRRRRDSIRNIITVDANRRVRDVISFFDLWRNSEVRFKHVGVVGLGYVGLTLALTLADRGFQVRGMDADPRVRRMLKRGEPHFYEAGLAELLRVHLGKNFEIEAGFTSDSACDHYVIAVGTPVSRSGRPQFAFLRDAAASVGQALKQGDAVILRSTVPVGTTRNVVIPVLERESGLIAGKDFYVAFCPERTAEGRALEELKRLPQVVGGIDRVSAEVAMHLFNTFTSYSIIVGSPEEAEMVKLVNNTYRDVTFGFSNELALVCQRWGIDTRRVIEAANRDYERSQVPMPSPGVGGYCLSKDPFIFIASAEAKRYTPFLTAQARRLSQEMINTLAGRILGFLRARGRAPAEAKVCLLGLAFKGEPVTSDLRGSTALELAGMLARRGVRVFGYDPAVDGGEVRRRGVSYAATAAAGIRNADAVVVMNNNPVFRKLPIRSLLARTRRPALFVDGWGLYPAEELGKVKHVEYFRL